MAIGTGFLNLGRLFINSRSNERLYTNTISSAGYTWNVSPSGIFGKGPSGNHPNIDELTSGDGSHWGRLFKGDSGNLVLTKRACSGFAQLAYGKMKKIDTEMAIANCQYDSGINQYRFYNYVKRSSQNLFGVKDAVQDTNISQYEQGYGKSLYKAVQLDVYSFARYDDQTKTTELSGTYYYPAFRHVITTEWYPQNRQQDAAVGWRNITSGISTESFFTRWSSPDSGFDGIMPGEVDEKLDPDEKHLYTWTSVNK